MHRKTGNRLAATTRWSASVAAVVLLLSSCGNSGGGSQTSTPTTTAAPTTTSAPTTTAAPTTTSAPTTTAAPTTTSTAPPDTTTSEATAAPEDHEQAVMDAWAVVFDSSAEFSAKLAHLGGDASLEAANAAYAATGERMGGISLEPTAAEVDGDNATVTYNVLFGETAAYGDLSGTLELIDGTWVVSRESYCGFLATARTPC